MSGFEVAGVVLGSLPLVISAVEAYMGFLKDWGKAPSELKSIHQPVDHRASKVVQSKDANDKIRRVFRDSYGPFEATVLEIKEALDDMKNRLQIDITRDGQVVWVNKGRMTREFKKFLYRLNRKEYQEDLTTIAKGVSDLEVLARLSVRLEPTRRKPAHYTILDVLRDLSTSVYRALRSSILCNDLHGVSLGLRAPDRDFEEADEADRMLNSAQFTIAISFEVHDGPTRKRFWDELSIKTTRRVARSAVPPLSARPAIISHSTAKRSSRVKAVSFTVAQKLSFITSSGATVPDVNMAMATMPQHATKVAFVDTSASGTGRTSETLVDLCVALRQARQARPAYYGHLVDKQHVELYFEVYPRGATADSDTWSVVTLCDVLEQKNGIYPLTSLKEKIRLALAIASSVLQLSKTPWLPEAPSSKDVHFFKRGQHLSYEHPFLLRNLPEPLFSASPSQRPTTIVDRNPTLFALGIMLLEIILGSTLESLREPREKSLVFPGDEKGIIRDTVTAHRLLEQRVALINPLYKVVVERCMECAASRDLDEENFRREVYNRVVLELEAILGHTSLGD